MQAPEQNVSAKNRRATPSEIDFAAMLLRSFADDTIVRLVETSAESDPEDDPVVVVSDFADIGDARIVLVPPGCHLFPGSLPTQVEYVIGLSSQPSLYPVLIVEGEETTVFNSDTLDESTVHIFLGQQIRFAGVVFDARKRTVIETYFNDGQQFSDMFFNVEWQSNVDALNIGGMVFLNAWDWTLDTYGSAYRGRSRMEKGLDGIHQGMMNVIDNTFRPLVRFGEKLDKLLGLK